MPDPVEAPRTLLPSVDDGDPLSRYEVPRPAPADRPWVLANFVVGLDGSVAVDGRVGPLTSPSDQEVFRRLRSVADVILVGAGTVRAERYAPARLSADQRRLRLARGQAPVPPIAVVSASLSFDWEAKFFAAAEARPLLFCPEASDPVARQRAAEHADVVQVGASSVDVAAALSILRQRGARIVLCEGGPELLGEILAVRVLDELCVTVSPMTGGDPLRLVGDRTPQPLTDFTLSHVLVHGDELFLRYLVVDRGKADG